MKAIQQGAETSPSATLLHHQHTTETDAGTVAEGTTVLQLCCKHGGFFGGSRQQANSMLFCISLMSCSMLENAALITCLTYFALGP